MSLDFEAKMSFKPVASSTLPSENLSPVVNETILNSIGRTYLARSWMMHPEFEVLFTEKMRSLIISIMRRRETVFGFPKSSFRHNIQGIDWNFLGIARSDARKLRRNTYKSYKNLVSLLNPEVSTFMNRDVIFEGGVEQSLTVKCSDCLTFAE